tara:strand:- start:218 stop:541 length:324 start_codon:yes stop_codon:yes gene_type:complete
MSDKSLVEKICGLYPKNFQSVKITEGEVYTFQNDPSYQVVKVFDADRNSVFVNSFAECEHYVFGGWNKIPEIDFIVFHEEFFHNAFLVLSIITVLFGIFSLKFKQKI